MKALKKTLLTVAIVLAALLIITPIIAIHIPQVRLFVFQEFGFIPNSIDAVFYFFCGILVAIGYLIGWTYQESSVYICIYLWPILLGLSSLPILYNSIRYAIQKRRVAPSIAHLAASALYVSVFGVICKLIWEHYNQPTIQQQFDKCMSDLIVHAGQLGISYNGINILFYIVLFAVVVAINVIIARLQKRYLLTSRS